MKIKVHITVLLFFISLGLMSQSQSEKNDFTSDSILRILGTDSTNYSANYQLGMLYYEGAVKLIRDTPYEVDLITLDEIQNESVELFRKALPYLERAYRYNPSKKEILSGLSALYFSLNELDKAQEYEDLNQKAWEKR